MNDVLNKSVPEFVKAVEKFNCICGPVKDNMARQIDALLSTDEEKAECKKKDDQWHTICDLFTDNNATLLFLERFGSDFRKEWKSKKKESLGRSDLYVDGKKDELAKLRTEVMDRVKENLAKVGIAWPDGTNETGEQAEEAQKEGAIEREWVLSVEEVTR